ncbi:MAG: hypothetical protein AB7K24_08735 [Gemmataceae bacterium]
MRHPFAGVEPVETAAAEPLLPRRAALQRMVFSAAGLFAAGTAAASTKAKGEEGGGISGAPSLTHSPTTEPFGEEAGKVTSIGMIGLEDGATLSTDGLMEEGGKAEVPAMPTDKVGEAGGGPKMPREPEITTFAVGEEGGRVRTVFLNEEGRGELEALTKAIGEEGRPGVRLIAVNVSPDTKTISPKQCDACWNQLAFEPAAPALQASAILYSTHNVITYLAGKLVTATKLPERQGVQRLIDTLDSEDFELRERASVELAKLGVAIMPMLEAARKNPPSLEVHARLTRLIDKCDLSEVRQLQRGLEILVALKNAAGRELIEKLMRGKPPTVLTALAEQAQPRTK